MGKINYNNLNPSLFALYCEPCAIKAYCPRSLQQQCVIPHDPADEARFWSNRRTYLDILGGIEPKRVSEPKKLPRLPQITHVHAESRLDFEFNWPSPMAIDAKDFIHIRHGEARFRIEKLRERFRDSQRLILYFSSKDPWYVGNLHKLMKRKFFDDLATADFDAVICPNLSCYGHSYHYVWQQNRAIIRNFYELAVESELPVVFFTYLEDSKPNQEWLTEFYQLNPFITTIATGFDRKAASNRCFAEIRFRLLQEIQDRIGRPLDILLTSALTSRLAVRRACSHFPGRVKLLGSSIFLRALKGSQLYSTPNDALRWRPSLQLPRGLSILQASQAALLDNYSRIPGFAGLHSLPQLPVESNHPAPANSDSKARLA